MLIYNRTAQGTEKPLRMVGGPKSQYSGGSMVTYSAKRLVVSTSSWGRGDGGQGASLARKDQYVGVWSIDDNGDIPPRWRLGGPNGFFLQTRNIDLDEIDVGGGHHARRPFFSIGNVGRLSIEAAPVRQTALRRDRLGRRGPTAP